MCKDLKEELRKRILMSYYSNERIIDVLQKIQEEYELDEFDVKKIINEDIKSLMFKQEFELNNLKKVE